MGLALFWVVFMWGFWEKGPFALGFNAFLFLSMFFGMFLWQLQKNGAYKKCDLVWIIPICCIILSFSIYDNPFIKIVSIPVLPILFVLFYNQASLPHKQGVYWGFEFLIHILTRGLSLVGQLGESVKTYTNKQLIVRVLIGVGIFLAAAALVFLPLLSAADAVFSEKVQVVTDWLQHVFSVPFIYKTGVFVLLSVLFYSMFVAWTKPFGLTETVVEPKQTDSVIVGIVLGGTLLVYLLFLWVQVNRLWVCLRLPPFCYWCLRGTAWGSMWCITGLVMRSFLPRTRFYIARYCFCGLSRNCLAASDQTW